MVKDVEAVLRPETRVSDFLFARAARPEGELRDVLERFLGPVSAEIVERHGAWGYAQADAQRAHDGETLVEDRALAHRPDIGTPVARIAPHAPDTRRAGRAGGRCTTCSRDGPARVLGGAAGQRLRGAAPGIMHRAAGWW
jgi:hypothetical protein